MPRIDPEHAAADPSFADPAVRGPAVEAARLTASALRWRFAHPPTAWRPEMAGDLNARTAAVAATERRRAAAVLVPLVERPEGLQVLLTRRADHLSDHAGQVSFPGGGIDPQDASPVAAALREAREEIGLDTAAVEILGTLPSYGTVTGFDVTPVVSLVSAGGGLDLRPDPAEVAEVFEVPLEFLMNPAHHQRRLVRSIGTPGDVRTFYAMPYPRQEGGQHFIWGATAAMLRNFYHFIRA